MYGVKWGKVNTTAEKIIIVASGTSLANFDFNILKNKGFIICVNDSYKSVPFANAWFTLDPWGLNGKQNPPESWPGKCYAAVPEDFGQINARINDHKVIPPIHITYLHRIIFNTCSSISPTDYETWGLNEDPSCINTLNSGYGALNLAYHMRPKKILLLGIDAGVGYFYDKNKNTRSLNHLPAIFSSALPQLKEKNIEVINGSNISKITCFQKYDPITAVSKF